MTTKPVSKVMKIVLKGERTSHVITTLVYAACNNAENPMAEAILQGVHRSYAFGGIPEDCGEGFGCKSDYWGKWCRYHIPCSSPFCCCQPSVSCWAECLFGFSLCFKPIQCLQFGVRFLARCHSRPVLLIIDATCCYVCTVVR